MADENGPSEDPPITFNVKSTGDNKYTLTMPLITTIADLKAKLSGDEYANAPADRLRLIYSGRVMKDPDTLDTYKVKNGNTIHLVKSAQSNARQNPAAQGASTTPSADGATTGSGNQGIPGVPTNFATGTGNNPLAGLTGARYAGFAQLPGAGMFGPDGGQGPPPDPQQMLNMLRNPMFQSQMNEALQNPAVIDMMIQQNPVLRDLGPGVRQMLQSEHFRRMMTDPDALEQQIRVQQALGIDPFGRPSGGRSAFPPPGTTTTTDAGAADTDNAQNQDAGSQQALNNPFAAWGIGNGGNPLAALFGQNPITGTAPSGSPPPAGQTAPSQGSEGTQGTARNTNAAANPFAMLLDPAFANAFNPSNPQQQQGSTPSSPPPQQGANASANNPLLQAASLMEHLSAAINAQNPRSTGSPPPGTGGSPNNFMQQLLARMANQPSPPPTDNRPPEDRYADQLRQLNDMGFYEFERNVEALRRSGGSVQGAVEYLLSHS